MNQKLRQDLPLGSVIRKMRLNAGMKQNEVVEQMELYGCATTRSTYSQIEICDYNLRVSELIALKQIFRVSYEDFFLELEKEEEARRQ